MPATQQVRRFMCAVTTPAAPETIRIKHYVFRPREVDMAYAAGLFDGEGCIYLRKQKVSYNKVSGETKIYNCKTSRITIRMTDIEPLELFQKAFPFVKLYGPRRASRKNEKEFWEITTEGFARCQAILAAIWSWLSPRRRDKWIEVCDAII